MGNGAALAIGVVAALWTGLGATLALGDALDRLWAVPRVNRFGALRSRLHGLVLLISIGSIMIASTLLAGLATEAAIQSELAGLISAIVSAVTDLLIFVACFRLLTSASVTTRQVLPGAAMAAIAWLALPGGRSDLRLPSRGGEQPNLWKVRGRGRPAVMAIPGSAGHTDRGRDQRRARAPTVAAFDPVARALGTAA